MKEYFVEKNISDYRNQKTAIDVYVWLHKGIYNTQDIVYSIMFNKKNQYLLQSLSKDRNIDNLSFKEKMKLVNDNLHNIAAIQ